ncbi:MAG: hypothetical protein ACR2P1_14515 [Pseudomonadales bacterium]
MIFTLLLCSLQVMAQEFSGEIAAELRYFFSDAKVAEQYDDFNASLYALPELYHRWNDGKSSLTFEPFARVDQHDDKRTHADVRELSWLTVANGYELKVGIGTVFWGVTESQHLVDIINQTDQLENIDGEDKLGQPMFNLEFTRDWGTLELFVLPGFREREFTGREGRLALQQRVDTDEARYESGAKDKHTDVALRWSQVFGDWDIGASHFYGTSREPRFVVALDGDEVVLVPLYEQISQTGLDVQATKGAWLWKLESVWRSGQGDSFLAATAGFEYTFESVFESDFDVGVLLEYLYDERDIDLATREPLSFVAFDNDLFFGIRLGFNDIQSTALLAGCVQDLDSSARFCNVEASRRFGDRWVLSLEARTFHSIALNHPLSSVRDDDHLQLNIAFHF